MPKRKFTGGEYNYKQYNYIEPKKRGRKSIDEKIEILSDIFQRKFDQYLQNLEKFGEQEWVVKPNYPEELVLLEEQKSKNKGKSFSLFFTDKELDFIKKESSRLSISKSDFIKMKVFTYMYRRKSTIEKNTYFKSPKYPVYFSKRNQNRIREPLKKEYDAKKRGEVYGEIGWGTPEAIEEERLRTRKWEREEIMRKKIEKERGTTELSQRLYEHKKEFEMAKWDYDVDLVGGSGVHEEFFVDFSPRGLDNLYFFKEDNPIRFYVYIKNSQWHYECEEYEINISSSDIIKDAACQSAKIEFDRKYQYLLNKFKDGEAVEYDWTNERDLRLWWLMKKNVTFKKRKEVK